jgi:hypothetical protein
MALPLYELVRCIELLNDGYTELCEFHETESMEVELVSYLFPFRYFALLIFGPSVHLAV